MAEDIHAKEVYQMFGEVKDEIHKASQACLRTQTKCHDIINKLDTDFRLHCGNKQLHLHCSSEKKNQTSFLKSAWVFLTGCFLR